MKTIKIIIAFILFLIGIAMCIYSWIIKIKSLKKKHKEKDAIKYNIISMVGGTLVFLALLLSV